MVADGAHRCVAARGLGTRGREAHAHANTLEETLQSPRASETTKLQRAP